MIALSQNVVTKKAASNFRMFREFSGFGHRWRGDCGQKRVAKLSHKQIKAMQLREAVLLHILGKRLIIEVFFSRFFLLARPTKKNSLYFSIKKSAKWFSGFFGTPPTALKKSGF